MEVVKVKDITTEDLMREGAKALIDKLGYADAARFIAIMGGEGDSVKDIREKRMKSDIDEITERIKRRRADRKTKGKANSSYKDGRLGLC